MTSSSNTQHLYWIEIDHGDDYYSTLCLYADNDDQAREHAKPSMYDPNEDKIILKKIFSLKNFNQQQLECAILSNLHMGRTDLFAEVFEEYRQRNIQPGLITLIEVIRCNANHVFEEVLSFFPLHDLRPENLIHISDTLGKKGSVAMIEHFMLECLNANIFHIISKILYGAAVADRQSIVERLAFNCDLRSLLDDVQQNPSKNAMTVQGVLEHLINHQQRQHIFAQVNAKEFTKLKKM